jgi:hypothetical protein
MRLEVKILTERLCGDPNALYGELGPPIPPSPREKLERILKVKCHP